MLAIAILWCGHTHTGGLYIQEILYIGRHCRDSWTSTALFVMLSRDRHEAIVGDALGAVKWQEMTHAYPSEIS